MSGGSTGFTAAIHRIVIDARICNGKPVIRGTRIIAQTVVEFLSAGDSIEKVLHR